jgi:ABC-type transporter Mla MlaB component
MAAHGRDTITFAIRGPVVITDLPGLCERFSVLLDLTAPEVAYCEVGDLDVDAVTIDALARLQLTARRRGCEIRLTGVCAELRELLAFSGLETVLPEQA